MTNEENKVIGEIEVVEKEGKLNTVINTGKKFVNSKVGTFTLGVVAGAIGKSVVDGALKPKVTNLLPDFDMDDEEESEDEE